jgi:hypothetical protein
MVKKSQSRNGLIILAVVVAILLTAIVVVAIQSRSSVQAPSSKDTVVIKGTAMCLPHKDTSGPQTMECAFGLKAENGQYYALSDTDSTYKNVASLPMGEKVEVTGTLEKSSSDTYPTVGTIKVTKVTKE